MGTIRHTAIVITSNVGEQLDQAASIALALGLQIVGPSTAAKNLYRSMLVCPDGSKLGLDDSEGAKEKRRKLCWQLSSIDPAGVSLSWVEINFGGDGDDAMILGDSNAQPMYS